MKGSTFDDQPIDSDIKQYKKMRKLSIGPGEYYTIGCLVKKRN